MSTIAEILKVAEKATNDTYAHYFTNLADGENKSYEVVFVADFLKRTQPWVFFTEGSLELMFDFINSDTLHLNLVYNLTSIWRQRFELDKTDYDTYIKHLSNSFEIQSCIDNKMSLMQEDYISRLPDKNTILSLLVNNPPLVLLASTVMYLDVMVMIPNNN